MLVRELMQPEVVTLCASSTLDLADDIMRLGRIRHLPVIAGDQLIGILSQRDLYRAAISSLLQLSRSAEQQFLAQVRVQDVMTPSPCVTTPDASIRSAVRLMLERKIGCLPVVEKGRLVGLIAESDCLRYLERVLETADAKGLLPELTSAS